MEQHHNPNLDFVYQLYQHLSNFNLSYIYKGDFSDTLNETILSLAETNMQIVNEPSALKKKVFFIMVESLQNITRHTEANEDAVNENSSLFIIQRKKKDYYITSGNIIDIDKVAPLEEKLKKVNSLDLESLKNYYREVLDLGEISSKGGAGLGLIEMARKSGNKLAFDFSPINENKSFFYFQSKVNLQTGGDNSLDHIEPEALNAAKNFHQIVLTKNLNFVFQGDFNHENMKTVLAMTEGNMDSSSQLIFRKRVINIIVELIQNIYKHANSDIKEKDSHSGIFMIERHEEKYILTSGNLIFNSRVEALVAKLERVNNSDVNGLNSLFNSLLMAEERVDQRGAGLGLIDMKLKSKHSLDYNISKVDNDFSFFTVQVKIQNNTH
ncbi:MAG: hypothetical protein IPP32_16950 [Bacteroidetes bacterium]|nr:hypothetical protein [Bacteroidota bacterium]